jgi:hypothetical protein
MNSRAENQIDKLFFSKIAAQICRKRKIDSIETLAEDVEDLKTKKAKLENERLKLKEQVSIKCALFVFSRAIKIKYFSFVCLI